MAGSITCQTQALFILPCLVLRRLSVSSCWEQSIPVQIDSTICHSDLCIQRNLAYYQSIRLHEQSTKRMTRFPRRQRRPLSPTGSCHLQLTTPSFLHGHGYRQCESDIYAEFRQRTWIRSLKPLAKLGMKQTLTP